jgi:spore germination cell wall hydrolase CwlJ-like protein
MDWPSRRAVVALILIVAGASLSACGMAPPGGRLANLSERDCMARVMYFESLRSSSDGMVAVGTVVENRRQSGRYPSSVCGVVGQRNQFADGALWKKMSGPGRARAYAAADAVLSGQRHPQVGSAMYFHTAGRWYPYNNMHYVAVAGGNAFYERHSRHASKPPFFALRPTAVAADTGGIESGDRVKLATFLNTGPVA